MSERVNFSQRLKTIIQLRGMRQSELCEKTKIGKSAMSQYLSGAFKPKQQNLYRLAKALDVSEAWLMGYDVPMERSDSSDNNTTCFYYTMEDDSMIGAYIPPNSRVLIEKNEHLNNYQIIACMINTRIYLRRFTQIDDHITLFPENSRYRPMFFTEKEFNSPEISILGTAKQVVIDL